MQDSQMNDELVRLIDAEQRRFRLYMGNLLFVQQAVVTVQSGNGVVYCTPNMNDSELDDQIRMKYKSERRVQMLRSLYIDPIRRLYKHEQIEKAFVVVVGDAIIAPPIPLYAKARTIIGGGQSVLLKLNENRHFASIGEVDACDRLYEDKNDNLVWRGAATGVFSRDEERSFGSRFYILSIRTSLRHKNIDVGYTNIDPLKAHTSVIYQREVERNGLASYMSIEEHLRSKFLLCLEGNDVASGLKWMMYSNSCVIMPKPRVSSWACEELLQPFVHYIPVRHDLSDILEVYSWCIGNPTSCKSVAANGKRFIEQFLDVNKERLLQAAVLHTLASKISYIA